MTIEKTATSSNTWKLFLNYFKIDSSSSCSTPFNMWITVDELIHMEIDNGNINAYECRYETIIQFPIYFFIESSKKGNYLVHFVSQNWKRIISM